jgi:glycosyltransferase involved in cell wall biosynthesis
VRLDVVIPAFNEQDRIGRTLAVYRSALPDPDTRFLVALDGCRDATADVVRDAQREDARVELHEFPKLGKGGVILETFRRADGELVAFVDADCATPPGELRRLIELARQPGVHGAIASRHHPASVLPRRRTLRRRVTSSAFATLVHALFGLPYRDTQCGAKVLRREAIEQIVLYVSSRDLVFDVDLLLVARALGLRVVEVPTVWIDQAGSRIDAVGDSKRMAAGLLRLWLQHRLAPIARPAGEPLVREWHEPAPTPEPAPEVPAALVHG